MFFGSHDSRALAGFGNDRWLELSGEAFSVLQPRFPLDHGAPYELFKNRKDACRSTIAVLDEQWCSDQLDHPLLKLG